jgi:hypothetical protein
MSEINNNTVAAGQRAKSELTFGIELEFVAMVPKKITMQYGSAQNYLISYLSNAQVKLPCNQPGCEEKEHEFLLPMHGDCSYEEYDYWKLATDTTIHLDDHDLESNLVDHSYDGLELISRVQKFEGTSPCPTGQVYPCTKEPLEWSWKEELRVFLQVVHEAFSGPGFCAIVNESTGFHVHLGKNPGHGDKGLPLEVAQGIMGTMTALERSFDQLLTTHRISGSSSVLIPGMWRTGHVNLLPGIQIEGFHALFKPGIIEDADFNNQWCPALSNAMFTGLHRQIYHAATQTDARRATTTSPTSAIAAAASATISAKTAEEIEQYLFGFNVPSWLNMIKGNSNIEQLKSMFYHDKYTALSLRGLGESNGPPTVEVRTHAGSLDFEEIKAWIDLLTSLAHWVETTPKEKVFSYLEESWRDVNYNICSLARAVRASDQTVAHYDFVLSSRYAQWRFEKYTSRRLNFTNKLENFNRTTEEQRRKAFSRENVDEKIRLKLESGRYGQLPTSFLEAQPEPEIFSRPEAKFLHLNGWGQKAWTEILKNFYRVEYQLDLTVKDSVDGSEASSDASPAGDVKDDNASDSVSVAAGADDEDDDSDGSDDSDKTVKPFKSPVKDITISGSEDDFDDEGFYGIHPALAGAYNQIPGQHLTHLEQTVISMPALPSPTTPNIAAFDELKDDTCARIHETMLNSAMVDGLTAATSRDEVENIIARAVEGTKQLHVLNACVTEKTSALRYLNKKGNKE